MYPDRVNGEKINNSEQKNGYINEYIIHFAAWIQKNNKLYFTLGGGYSKIYIDEI